MIDFDYEIERDEGDEVRSYFPDKIASPLESSTAYIEGPNSSGKSTLLHLIALGFHGLENEDLARPLREKLEDLIGNDKIVFDIKVRDKEGNVILQTKKEDKEKDEITTYCDRGNGLESTDSDTFRENYKLIYDIPDNPTERIEQIADDVKYYQTDVANHLSDFHNYTRGILEDITEGRDPKRISRIKEEIKGKKSNLTMLKNQAIRDNKEFDLLSRYAYPYLLQIYKGNLSSIDSKIKQLRSSVASKRKAKSTTKNKFDSTIKTVQNVIKQTQNEYHDADVYLKTILHGSEHEDFLNGAWSDIDFVAVRTKYSFPENFIETCNEISDICQKIYLENKEAEQTSNVYSQIIETLKEVTYNQIKMPDIGISLNDFIADIELLKEETETQARKAKNARKAKESLDKLITLANSLRLEHFPNLLRLSEKAGGKGRTDDAGIQRMEDAYLLKRRKIKAKVEEYQRKCAIHGVPEFEHTKMIRENKKKIEKFLGYTEDQLSEELEYSEDEMKKSGKQLELAKDLISRHEDELERLENRKPHKYEDQKDVIENLMNYLGSLERKFLNTFSKALDHYRSKKTLPNKSNFPEEYEMTKSYYEGVSSYLGAKLGTIRHIEGEYTVTKVDLVSGEVTTDSGKIIRLRAMGTGQTQSTYLQSKLKTDYGDRKLIVMFDEVGAMDENSMEPIKKMIRKLKDDGSLLVGLVVQRLNSGVKITPI